jgi:hypothetical protein
MWDRDALDPARRLVTRCLRLASEAVQHHLAGPESAPLVEALGRCVAHHHSNLQITDAESVEFLVHPVEQLAPDAPPAVVGRDRQRVELRRPLTIGQVSSGPGRRWTMA